MTSKSSARAANAATADSRRLFLSGPASMIWTTTSSSSYGTTLGIHSPAVNSNHHNNHLLHNGNMGACMTLSASYNNNRHPHHHHPALTNHHHHVNSSGGSSSSSSSFTNSNNNNSSTSTLAPLISSGNSQDNTTRINNYAFNNQHFKTTARCHNQSQASPQVTTPNSSFVPAFQVARDRKPLTPEYEVPSFVNNNNHHHQHQQQPLTQQSLFYPQHTNPYLHQSMDRLDQDFLSSLPVSGLSGSSPATTSLDDDPLHQTSLSDDKSNHIYSHIYDPASHYDRHSIPIRHPSDKLTYFTHRGLDHHHYDPIREEIEKRRRRKCLLLGSLFAIAVFLAIMLLSSFIMFVVSSYQVEVQKTEDLKQQAATLKTTDVYKDAGVLTRTMEPPELSEVDVLNHTEAFLVTTVKSLPSADTGSSNNNNMINSNANNNNNVVSGIGSSLSNFTILKVDDEFSCLEGEEWRCRDGLCIPQEKRCDGHFNCYDHSDENDCDPCPLSEGYFRCGSETSCLEPSKRCNGVFDCWDGSDEHLCIKSN